MISIKTEKDKNGKSKGIAYIEMYVEDAKNAITALNSSELNGNKIVVKKATPDNQNE